MFCILYMIQHCVPLLPVATFVFGFFFIFILCLSFQFRVAFKLLVYFLYLNLQYYRI